MTDQQWYELTKANYEKVATELVEQGYKRSPRQDIYKEQFSKDGKILVIVRELGNANWFTKQLTFESDLLGKVTIPEW